MATNDFVPFCNENTGTNLPSQSAYIANPNLPIGNQPGIASSSFNNKPLRQATTIAAVMAQLASDYTGVDMLDNQNTADHAIPAALFAAMNAALVRLPESFQEFTSSGTWNMPYWFFIVSGSATAGATYTNNGVTYTVVGTVASGLKIQMTGNGDPLVAGTLTKSGGTGDTTLTFYAFRKPIEVEVELCGGGGGGGAGSNNGGGSSGGGGGGTTTFGPGSATGGGKGNNSGAATGGGGGGTPTITTSATVIKLRAIDGANGQGATHQSPAGLFAPGGQGGSNPFGGSGMGAYNAAGIAGKANSGAGGGGGANNAGANAYGSSGGGAGGYAKFLLLAPASTYTATIGAGGAGETPAAGGYAGAAGADGWIGVRSKFQ